KSPSTVTSGTSDPPAAKEIEEVEREGERPGLEYEEKPYEKAYPPTFDTNLVRTTDAQPDDDQPMTTSVPKELTPVSPLPLHVAEPSNIPLLMDPALSRTTPNDQSVPSGTEFDKNMEDIQNATSGNSGDDKSILNADAPVSEEFIPLSYTENENDPSNQQL